MRLPCHCYCCCYPFPELEPTFYCLPMCPEDSRLSRNPHDCHGDPDWATGSSASPSCWQPFLTALQCEITQWILSVLYVRFIRSLAVENLSKDGILKTVFAIWMACIHIFQNIALTILMLFVDTTSNWVLRIARKHMVTFQSTTVNRAHTSEFSNCYFVLL